MSRTTLKCRIETLETLGAGVTRVFLRTDGNDVPYAPGQYLEIAVEVDGERRWTPFSIGNAYRGDGLLELHILKVLSSRSNVALSQRLKVGELFDVRLPAGESVFDLGDKRPLLLVAAGTGFAQMKAIIEAALSHNPDHQIDLWWAARTLDELYLDDLAREWTASYPNVHYHPVVEAHDDNDERAFDGLVDRVDHALAQTLTQTQHYSVYISGSPGMVYAVIDTLEAIEPLTEYIFSDVFSYAPRPIKSEKVD